MTQPRVAVIQAFKQMRKELRAVCPGNKNECFVVQQGVFETKGMSKGVAEAYERAERGLKNQRSGQMTPPWTLQEQRQNKLKQHL